MGATMVAFYQAFPQVNGSHGHHRSRAGKGRTMQSRYRPFSGAGALTDEPVSRRGSSSLLFLEPKG
jgi:hypothetical protein